MIGPEALHARPPEVAQESTHRPFTGSLRARGCCVFPWYCVFRHAADWGGYSCGAAWGGAPPFRVPPGAEHLVVIPTVSSTSFVVTPGRCMGLGGAQVRGGAGRGGAWGGAVQGPHSAAQLVLRRAGNLVRHPPSSLNSS